jgi:hypothetical protein
VIRDQAMGAALVDLVHVQHLVGAGERPVGARQDASEAQHVNKKGSNRRSSP